MNKVKTPFLFSFLLITTLLISACTKNNKSEESEISQEDTQEEAKQEEVNKENSTINGTVSYSESMTPPTSSKLYVRLNNISLADASSVNIEEQVFDLSERSVPVSYAFSIPKDTLKPKQSYAVQAEIRGADDGLLWTTETNSPVDSSKTSQTLDEILMISVKPVTASDNIMDLININWQVSGINGAAVIDKSETNLTFSADGKLSGLAGCNRFNGDYKLHNAKLSVGPLAVTKKACLPEINGQEIQFLNAISSVDNFSFDAKNSLILKTADGKIITAQRP